MTDDSWQQRNGYKIKNDSGCVSVQLDRALNAAEVLRLLTEMEKSCVATLRVGRECILFERELSAWNYFYVAYPLAVRRLQTPWLAAAYATFCGALAYRWYVGVERIVGCPPLSGLPLTPALLEDERLRECFELGFRLELEARRHWDDAMTRIPSWFVPEDLQVFRGAILRVREELAHEQGRAPPTLLQRVRARTWAFGARLRAIVARAIGQHPE